MRIGGWMEMHGWGIGWRYLGADELQSRLRGTLLRQIDRPFRRFLHHVSVFFCPRRVCVCARMPLLSLLTIKSLIIIKSFCFASIYLATCIKNATNFLLFRVAWYNSYSYSLKGADIYVWNIGGIGTKRFCSAVHMGNYCDYVRQPGDKLTYRTCVFTCSGDGCNPAMSLVPGKTVWIVPMSLLMIWRGLLHR